MALDTYANLSTAIGTWGVVTYSTSQTDEFLVIAEDRINSRLGPHYKRETTTTLTTNSAGQATLPSDFAGFRSVVRDVVGSLPLNVVSWRTLISLNPHEVSGDPTDCAISGTTFMVAPVCEDDFIVRYWATLAPLSSSQTTNWLLTAKPSVYLFYCRAAQAAFEHEFDVAAVFQRQGDDALDDLVAQSVVAQYGSAEMVIEGVTP